jgi:hypothetical protein
MTPVVARGSAFVPYGQPGFAANTLLSGSFHTVARIEAAEPGAAGDADGASRPAAVGSDA